ncbi:outer membrane beta-barrel protein [Roseivirga pacifica]|uniref:outer membrane beta-barrel protein n=1 Tax=Roseivirga pacifica TaxID=1267423 RepID=UPI003BA9F6AA
MERLKLSTLVVLITLLTFTLSAHAQDKGHNEITLGIGGFTSNDFLNDVANLTSSGGDLTYENSSTIGFLYITYGTAIAKNLMVNAIVGYQSISEDVLTNGSNDGEVKRNYITTGLEADYAWIAKEKFRLYSGLGIAYTTQNDKYDGNNNNIEDGDDSFFNFQVNALGARFGDTIAAFAEVGFGYKGMLSLGVSFGL